MSLIDQVREVLLKSWDPFGVGDNKNLSDEYDAFIPRIIPKLGADKAELIRILVVIENELSAPTTQEEKDLTVN